MKESTTELLALLRKLESPGLQNLITIKLHTIEHGRKTPFLFNVANMGIVKRDALLASNGLNSTIELTAPINGVTVLHVVEDPNQFWKKVNEQTVLLLGIAMQSEEEKAA